MRESTLRPTLEVLESRDVPSAAVLSQGTLYVVGTEQPDQIRVAVSLTNATKIDVTVISGGTQSVQSFDRTLVDNLVVRGKAGNDYIRNDTNLRSAIFGGTGDDIIWGGSNRDFLFGNQGNDRLYGAAGNDLLDGGVGNDVLEGFDGIDILLGGLGDDRLYGQNGNDRLAGGPGADIVSGGPGSDVLFGDLTGDTAFFDGGEDVPGVGLKRELIATLNLREIGSAIDSLTPLTHRPGLVFSRAGVALDRVF